MKWRDWLHSLRSMPKSWQKISWIINGARHILARSKFDSAKLLYISTNGPSYSQLPPKTQRWPGSFQIVTLNVCHEGPQWTIPDSNSQDFGNWDECLGWQDDHHIQLMSCAHINMFDKCVWGEILYRRLFSKNSGRSTILVFRVFEVSRQYIISSSERLSKVDSACQDKMSVTWPAMTHILMVHRCDIAGI
jgi:hypothetical protein